MTNFLTFVQFSCAGHVPAIKLVNVSLGTEEEAYIGLRTGEEACSELRTGKEDSIGLRKRPRIDLA